MLDLQSGGTNTGIAEQVHQQLGAEVADTDAASQLLVCERLHGGPGFLDGGGAHLDLVVGGFPAWGVADGWVDVLQGDGEVHDVQVKVVDAPVGELLAADRLDLVAVVEAVPQLGDDEELLALDDALLDGAGDTLAALNLVAVVWEKGVSVNCALGAGSSLFCVPGSLTACAVEQTVTSLDGAVDLVGAGVVVHLPQTEAHEGHVKATAQLNGRGSHFERI